MKEISFSCSEIFTVRVSLFIFGVQTSIAVRFPLHILHMCMQIYKNVVIITENMEMFALGVILLLFAMCFKHENSPLTYSSLKVVSKGEK